MAGNGEISGVESFNSAWSNSVTQEESKMSCTWLERHLVPLDKSARNYEVKKQQCLLVVKQMFSGTSVRKGDVQRKKTREIWLQTEDGKVGGYVDAILPTADGDVVIDYKTGQIVETSPGHSTPEVKNDYQIQLKLYAALYYSEYRTWPKSLNLIGMDSTSYSIQFDPESCLRLLNEAYYLLNDINSIIINGGPDDRLLLRQLSSPTPENCRFCHYRPCCPPYWEKIKWPSLKEWPYDAKGIIKERKILGNGRMLIRLVLDTDDSKNIAIRGLQPDRHPAINKSDKIAIFSMGFDSVFGRYKEGSLTTIYCRDG